MSTPIEDHIDVYPNGIAQCHAVVDGYRCGQRLAYWEYSYELYEWKAEHAHGDEEECIRMLALAEQYFYLEQSEGDE